MGIVCAHYCFSGFQLYIKKENCSGAGDAMVVTGQRGPSGVFDFSPGEIKRRIHQMLMLRTQKLECLCRAPGLRANALMLLGSRGRLKPKSTWAETPSDWCCGNSCNHLAGKPPDSSPRKHWWHGRWGAGKLCQGLSSAVVRKNIFFPWKL